jgi:pantoate kinase
VSESRWTEAEAFAPAHVTGVFAPAVAARDPRARGSTGAGIVLELGVHAHAKFRPGPRRGFRVSSDLGIPLPISEEVTRRLAPRRGGTLSVHLVHDLPVGQGFGSSAAGAAATALAVGALSRRPRTELMEIAHLADLFGGGGLGGVASIVGGGGLEFRTRGGLPPLGRALHRPLPGTLFVGVVGGPLPSPAFLRDARFLSRVGAASEGLAELLRHPDERPFFELSEQFTDRLGLVPPSLERLLRALRRRGAWAAQAMFGRSFFVRPRSAAVRRDVVRWLGSAGIAAVEVAAARQGARLLKTTHRPRVP